MSSGKWRPSCLGLNVLNMSCTLFSRDMSLDIDWGHIVDLVPLSKYGFVCGIIFRVGGFAAENMMDLLWFTFHMTVTRVNSSVPGQDGRPFADEIFMGILVTIGSMGPQKPNEQYIERRWRSWRSQRSWCSCAQPTQPAQPEL